MKFTDRVLRNPLTSLIGVAFAIAGVMLLKWSDDLSEASRVFLAILCFVIAMTGLGWRDNSLLRVLQFFKNKTPVFVVSSIAFLGVSSCVSNRHILEEIRAFRAQQEAITNNYNIQIDEINKKFIDEKVQSMADDDLLNYVEQLANPKPVQSSTKRKN